MKSKFILWISVLFFISMFSCKKKSNTEEKEPTTVYSLDLSNSQFLAVLPIQPQSADPMVVYSDPHTLYKVTTDGSLQEIIQRNVNGNKIPTSFATFAVCNIDNDYIFLVTTSYTIYLVRKSDGVLFKILTDEYFSYLPQIVAGKISVQKDGNNFIYFSANNTNGTHLYKVNISNPNQMRAVICSPSNESVNAFAVDSRGNILFQSSVDGSNYYRLKKANGSTENINLSFYQLILGTDDQFYFSHFDPTYVFSIHKLTIDASYSVTYTNLGNYPNTSFGGDRHLTYGTKTIFTASNLLTELDPVNGINNSSLPTTSITDMSYSDTHFYLAGNSSSNQGNIFKISLNNYGSYTNPVSASVYSAYKVVSSDNNVIVFSALRLSDSQNVLVRVDSNGNETVLKEGLEPQAVIFEKID